MKYYELQPTEDNLIDSLRTDYLGRNESLLHFYRLLSAQTELSSIAIDGEWGSGKTFFVKQEILLINSICNTPGINENNKNTILSLFQKFNGINDNPDSLIVFYFDAWQNDHQTNPIMSLLFQLTKEYGLNYYLDSNNSIFNSLVAVFDAIKGSKLESVLNSFKSNNPLQIIQEQDNLDQKIKAFLSDILAEHGNRIVVFIDELDRCKPDFAVRLLEQIKHYIIDDRVTFVFSVSIEQLQHTIKHYYGEGFDACRYLDRFFNLRIMLPPSEKRNLFSTIGLNDECAVEMITKRFADVYKLEIRETIRLQKQVTAAVYKPTHNSQNMYFFLSEGKGKEVILMYIVPILIGLRMVNIDEYNSFIAGENVIPLINIFDNDEMKNLLVPALLQNDESLYRSDGKKIVKAEDKLRELYDAIFAHDYSTERTIKVGAYQFNEKSAQFAIQASSTLTHFSEYT